VQSSTREIAADIQRYCAAHPDACDTIEGITWWVQMQRREDLRSGVYEAVQWLVGNGLLECHRLNDGSEVFGCKCEPPKTS